MTGAKGDHWNQHMVAAVRTTAEKMARPDRMEMTGKAQRSRELQLEDHPLRTSAAARMREPVDGRAGGGETQTKTPRDRTKQLAH